MCLPPLHWSRIGFSFLRRSGGVTVWGREACRGVLLLSIWTTSKLGSNTHLRAAGWGEERRNENIFFFRSCLKNISGQPLSLVLEEVCHRQNFARGTPFFRPRVWKKRKECVFSFPPKGLWVGTQDLRVRKSLLLASLKTLVRLRSFFLQMRQIHGNRSLFWIVGIAVNVSFLWLAVSALALLDSPATRGHTCSHTGRWSWRD